MNELQNGTKFKENKECLEGTCNHVQGLFPCTFHVHRVMAEPSSWPMAKELGKNVALAALIVEVSTLVCACCYNRCSTWEIHKPQAISYHVAS